MSRYKPVSNLGGVLQSEHERGGEAPAEQVTSIQCSGPPSGRNQCFEVVRVVAENQLWFHACVDTANHFAT